jgi:rhamnosyltransferase subunit B
VRHSSSNMRIMLVVFGTAGDVFPLIGVGRALQQRGHEVHLASLPEYQGSVERAGLTFHVLKGIPGTRDALDFYHPTRSMRVVAERLLIPALRPVYELLSLLDPADWTVIANAHSYGARIAQEKHGFWLTTCVVTPFSLLSLQRMPILPGIACPPWAPMVLRRAFFGVVARLWDRALAPSVNAFRESLGLGTARNIWYQWCLSPHRVIGLYPEWFAPKPTDWPAQFVYGGFTVFDQGVSQEFPAELLEPGDPLVVFAAGSAGQTATAFFQNAITASSGQRWRAVLLTGEGGGWFNTGLPRNVFRYNYVPMSQLLPLSSLVVHHGGLGTISLALSAAVPQIVIPFGHDQFDNAARIEQLGVGCRILKSGNLPLRLRSTIERMLQDPSWSARCRVLAPMAAIERSLAIVCEQIEADDSQNKQRLA